MSHYADMQCQLVDGYGSDLLVLNAARVSFNKRTTYLTGDDFPIDEKEINHKLLPAYKEYLRSLNPEEFLAGYPVTDWKTEKVGKLYYGGLGPKGIQALSFKDFRLIFYLAKKHHWTPFGHGSFTFRLKAPLFVARQLGKHQTGLVWNEVSRRYYDGPVEFFKMDYKRASGDKRIEGEGFVEADPRIVSHELEALSIYNDMLKAGAAAEDIRSILPQNMMTEWYWSGSSAAFLRVVGLRTKLDTQRQTRKVADNIANVLKSALPVSFLAHHGFPEA